MSHFYPSPALYFLKDFSSKLSAAKSNILRRGWRKFESNKFVFDFDQAEKEQILCGDKSDVNFLMNQYLSEIDGLLEIQAPIKKLNRKEMEFLNKPWITQGLKNSLKKYTIYSI